MGRTEVQYNRGVAHYVLRQSGQGSFVSSLFVSPGLWALRVVKGDVDDKAVVCTRASWGAAVSSVENDDRNGWKLLLIPEQRRSV